MIIDENGMYAYVDSSERSSSLNFAHPKKDPVSVTASRYVFFEVTEKLNFYASRCQTTSTASTTASRSKGKKKKCVFKCDNGFKVNWQNSKLHLTSIFG